MGRAAIASARERDDSADEVIVTARRVESTSNWKASAPPRLPQARRTSKPGDWNACTVNDPARSLGGCSELASGHVAEGLSRAWQGDLEGAIAEFDQAIAASQQSGFAHLNRGLAYERKGDRDRALADLDRAVQQAPNSARAYYNRSLVLYRKGEKSRAGADADRAIELDPRYAAVIR
jgi:tetratricopeptide (TPR) repeat protein